MMKILIKKYFVSDESENDLKKLNLITPFLQFGMKIKVKHISRILCALRAGASYNYLVVNGIRRPTPRELLRLQGFPDSFKIVVPYTQIRKQAGNSVSVPVIEAVAKEMVRSINSKELASPPPKQTEMWEELECRVI